MKAWEKDKVLILSGTFGEGHQQVAYAVREIIQWGHAEMEPIVIDFMSWVHPHFYPISRYVYMKGIKKFPSIYGYFYEKTRNKTSYSMKLNKFLSFGMKKMLMLLQEVQPSVVVCTFPFAAGVMSKLKEAGLTNIPTVTIITDYTVHSYWVHSHTDQYIVGSSLVRQALNRMGIEDFKIADIGIPVHPKFNQTKTREILAKKYGLDSDVPSILVMGGGYGIIGDGFLTFQALENIPHPLQLIIVCGHNEKLRHQLEERLKFSKHRILLTGFIDYVHELMAVSDLIITKPGGVTTSEAMAMKLPMLLYRPLPGQEQDNARFLVQAGVAIQAQNLVELAEKILYILLHPQFLKRMKENMNRLHIRGSAVDALDVIARTMHKVPVSVPTASPVITHHKNRLSKKRPIHFLR